MQRKEQIEQAKDHGIPQAIGSNVQLHIALFHLFFKFFLIQLSFRVLHQNIF